jgi:trehalose/maltose transport system substrate-binding protein
MNFVRTTRRVLIAAVSLGALLAVAACGGSKPTTPSGGGSAGGGVDLTKQGDIEYWAGKDTSGNLKNLIDKFNSQHPNGKVTFHELPDNADLQQQQMIQNTQVKNPKMAVLSVDVVWTAQFAANGSIIPLPADQFPTEGFLKATIDSATYFNKMYAYPATSDGGLLYYRKDLLDKAGISEPPKTWDEMKGDCDKVKQLPDAKGIDCFAGQYNKYEGLTCNFDEAVHGAGGVIIGDDGKPNVNTPEATKGLSRLVNFFKDGTIPKGAITWQEEQGRQAFQKGKLIFHRNWGYVYNLAAKTDGSSDIVGKYAVAPLVGETGPGVSTLGGHNMAIATNAENKGTAVDFIKFMTSEEIQKNNTLATSNSPTLSKLYTDPDIVKKFPFMPIQLKSIETAKPRPKAVKYSDVTLAIQDAAYGALQGQTAPDAALSTLQTKLQSLTQ